MPNDRGPPGVLEIAVPIRPGSCRGAAAGRAPPRRGSARIGPGGGCRARGRAGTAVAGRRPGEGGRAGGAAPRHERRQVDQLFGSGADDRGAGRGQGCVHRGSDARTRHHGRMRDPQDRRRPRGIPAGHGAHHLHRHDREGARQDRDARRRARRCGHGGTDALPQRQLDLSGQRRDGCPDRGIAAVRGAPCRSLDLLRPERHWLRRDVREGGTGRDRVAQGQRRPACAVLRGDQRRR